MDECLIKYDSNEKLAECFARDYSANNKPISISFKTLFPKMNKSCRYTHLIQAYPAKLLAHIPFKLNPKRFEEGNLRYQAIEKRLSELESLDVFEKFNTICSENIIRVKNLDNISENVSSRIIIEENPNSTNIYLSPLSTKSQTVGMALFYITNYKEFPISIIFPYSKTYTSKHAEGIKRIWKYAVEF